MRMRFWMVACLCLCLLAPFASAKQKKPHSVGKHPQPNHAVTKVKKSKKSNKIKH